MSAIRAQMAARELLELFDVRDPKDIRLQDFAGWEGVLLEEKPIDGSEGRLVTHGERAMIVVNNRITEVGKRRFVIAHELGHFHLHRSDEGYALCNERAFVDWHGGRPHETEANEFAAELLMPRPLFRSAARATLPNLSTINELSGGFRTTRMATAFRYVELDLAPCAIIYSEAGTIEWFNCSDSLPCGFVPVGNEVSPNSGAGEYFNNGTTSESPEPTPVEAWFGDDDLDTTLPCWEQCLPMPRYEGILSLLWID